MERMQRDQPAAARDSGWFIGCVNQAHDHDRPENLMNTHLLHPVGQRMYIFPYLSLPVGSAVAFEPDKVIVFAPGAETANPFTDLGDSA